MDTTNFTFFLWQVLTGEQDRLAGEVLHVVAAGVKSSKSKLITLGEGWGFEAQSQNEVQIVGYRSLNE